MKRFTIIVAFLMSCSPSTQPDVKNENPFFEPDKIGEEVPIEEELLPDTVPEFGAKRVIWHTLSEDNGMTNDAFSEYRSGRGDDRLFVTVAIPDRLPHQQTQHQRVFKGLDGPWATDEIHMYETNNDGDVESYDFGNNRMFLRAKWIWASFDPQDAAFEDWTDEMMAFSVERKPFDTYLAYPGLDYYRVEPSPLRYRKGEYEFQ